MKSLRLGNAQTVERPTSSKTRRTRRRQTRKNILTVRGPFIYTILTISAPSVTVQVSGAIHLGSSPLQPVPGDGHNYRKYKNIDKNSSHRSPLCQPYISAPNTTISALRLNRRSAPLRSIKRSLEYMCKTESGYSSDRSPLHWGVISSSNLSVSADRRSYSEYEAPT